jgi:hypothetical protein
MIFCALRLCDFARDPFPIFATDAVLIWIFRALMMEVGFVPVHRIYISTRILTPQVAWGAALYATRVYQKSKRLATDV